uniref:Uncharacterized protein n=1 Tax=Nonomuraea gerenzanensis TaxID=93944 RepID=A0A1M4DYV2_9ACTN|nr:hypothetical protein [Nonomuraea gerenzanensis]SBO91717.1 hypothetical protein BN4615_P1231 [Nonomuraea gerenzanensis]
MATHPVLENSAREVLKGTLVPVRVSAPGDAGSGAMVKRGALRQLELSSGDVDAVLGRLQQGAESAQAAGSAPGLSATTIEVLRGVESAGPAGAAEAAGRRAATEAARLSEADVARLPAAELARFAETLVLRHATGAGVRARRRRSSTERPSACARRPACPPRRR